jgi:hypothetical protein
MAAICHAIFMSFDVHIRELCPSAFARLQGAVALLKN